MSIKAIAAAVFSSALNQEQFQQMIAEGLEELRKTIAARNWSGVMQITDSLVHLFPPDVMKPLVDEANEGFASSILTSLTEAAKTAKVSDLKNIVDNFIDEPHGEGECDCPGCRLERFAKESTKRN